LPKSPRRWRFPVAIFATLVVIDLMSFFAYRALFGRWLDFGSEYEAELSLSAPRQWQTPSGYQPATRLEEKGLTLHPYLGFVVAPDSYERPSGFHNDEYGFSTAAPLIQPAAPNHYNVLILGGSLAYYTSARAGDVLRSALSRLPALKGKTIEISTAALGGYKEPQQLLTVAYLLSLGAHFDLIVNLDGFNDIALSPTEQRANDVFPFYPREWNFFTSEMSDSHRLQQLGALVAARERRRFWAALISESWIRHSSTATVLWKLYDRRLAADIIRKHSEVEASGVGHSYLRQGPERHYQSDDAMYNDLAEVWKRSSLQIHHLAIAAGARYVHILQPNQYDLGAKPISPAERAIAVNEHSPYRIHVERGYDYLRRAGRQLAQSGVAFHDLTQIFRNEKQVLYEDDCCHLNLEGSRRLAAAIGALIAE
jgi:hypothetical protein